MWDIWVCVGEITIDDLLLIIEACDREGVVVWGSEIMVFEFVLMLKGRGLWHAEVLTGEVRKNDPLLAVEIWKFRHNDIVVCEVMI